MTQSSPLIDRLEEFAALLRQNGLRVSTSEVIDAARALSVVGIEHGDAVRHALSTTLIKRGGDLSAFQELFELYFMRGATLAAAGGTPLVDMLAEQGLSSEVIEQILAQLADEIMHLGAAARMGLGVRSPDIAPLVQAAGLQSEISRIASPLQIGYYTHRVTERLDLRGASAQIDGLMARIAGSAGLTSEQYELLREVVARNLTALRQAIRSYVKQEFQRQNLDFMQQLAARTLSDKPLAQLTEQEVAELRYEVKRLARMLRARVRLQPKQHRRGRLDLRRTLRQSLATGGIPFVLRRRERRRRKPRLLVLCDISDSVRNVSRFMLQFVYTLQELFDRVHSFVFVAELGEVTDLFGRYELDRAVELAYQGTVINVFANSNYGRVLEQFNERHMDKLTNRTTVVVIGDGRNNYHASNHAILGDIRRRAKQVLWLNPEAPSAWGFGDSVMREYEPHCDEVVVTFNLASLRKVVDELVLH